MAYPLGQCYDTEAALPADASTLQVVGYSLGAIASLPRRLANPPPRQSKLELHDVLEDRHCAPIALNDFENYLAFTEHSVENLYFALWLKAYTDEYANAAQSDSTTIARVSDSVTAAARTYIEVNAPYEINLTDENRSNLLILPAYPPPSPSAYNAAQREVQWLLEESLRRWEKRALSNAGWRRLAFSTYVGFCNACVTVVAMVIARIYAPELTGRIVAACLTPWLWFAIVGVICGLKGVCFLCYSMGGTVRQVSSFELALPRRRTSINDLRPSLTSFASYNPSVFPHDDASDKGDEPFSPHSERGKEFNVKSVRDMRHRRTAASKEMLVKLWAPMVAVEDPLVIRAHWEAVFQGFLWSLFLAVPIGVVAAAA